MDKKQAAKKKEQFKNMPPPNWEEGPQLPPDIEERVKAKQPKKQSKKGRKK